MDVSPNKDRPGFGGDLWKLPRMFINTPTAGSLDFITDSVSEGITRRLGWPLRVNFVLLSFICYGNKSLIGNQAAPRCVLVAKTTLPMIGALGKSQHIMPADFGRADR